MNPPDNSFPALELLRRFDRPGPRYTSYPTAVEFSDDYTESDYRERLVEADKASGEPLSLYVHLPFCEERCSFCGCHVVITKKRDVSRRYLDYLFKEIDMLAEHIPGRRVLSQYHWGGGTPTYQSLDEMRALHDKVSGHFDLEPDAEVAIEVDPRVTSHEQIDVVSELGFNRVSMGVQDFTPEVQAAITRNQTEDQTRDLYGYCRKVGVESINLDLIYGLPAQTERRFADNLDVVCELRPDRLAVYSWAYVPWVKANQKKLDASLFPSPELKLTLFCMARERFLSEGYVQIGMDHFALPDDELAQAVVKRRLHRNFMGYTVKMGADMLGVGVSSIGDVRATFAQNAKKLSTYYDAIEDGRFPVERGYVLNRDDEIRRAVIMQLMCNFHLDTREVETQFGIDFDSYFAAEVAELTGPEGAMDLGFLKVTPEAIDVEGHGRLFIRNICMIFDRYQRTKTGDTPIFSRTV
jgi:oxygen-independent coproporphyrinogen-3 oxidase